MCGGGGRGVRGGRGRGDIGFALQPLNSPVIRMVSKEYLTGQININLNIFSGTVWLRFVIS